MGGSGGDRRTEHRQTGRRPGLRCGGQGVALARAGLAHHHLHQVTPGGEPADHRDLLGVQPRARGQRRFNSCRVRDAGPDTVPGHGGVQDEPFDGEHLVRGVPGEAARRARHGGPGVGVDGHDARVGEQPIGQRLDVADAGPGRELAAPGPDRGTPVEHRAARGQPVRSEQPVGGRGEHLGTRRDRGGAAQRLVQVRGVEPQLPGAGLPQACERHRVHARRLGRPGGRGGQLRRPRAGGAVTGELRLDLLPPPREPAQHRPRDPVHLRGAVRVHSPGQAERRELVAQRRLVQRAGGLGLQVQLPPVQRRPAPIRPPGHVRHQHMGVQLRIPRPRRPMPERRRDEPPARQPVPAVLTPADLPRLPLQIPHRLGHRRVMRTADKRRQLLVAQREQQRHRLRRGERQVQPRQPVRTPHPQQRPPRGRIPAVQHRPQTLRRHPADQTQPRRPRPHPPTRRLTRPQVVVLHPRRNRPQVVPLRAAGELADAQHHGHLASDTGTADVVAGHAYPPSQSARDGPRGTAAPDATAASVR